jgi:hypothetical protein
MELEAIINAVADEADDFLAGITTKAEARTVILSYLGDHYPDLAPGACARVASGLLAILDREGFFDTRGPRDAWSEGESDDASAD